MYGDIIQLIIDKYTAPEIVDILEMSAEDLVLGHIREEILNNLDKFEELVEEYNYGEE